MIMHGDVLSPSSNMVDNNLGKFAVATSNIYLYKNKVAIPPLLMQDDTLTVSRCGFKTTKINSFINTQTNIMGLQFGKDKCIKMHIGKTHNEDICTKGQVDAWKDKIVTNEEGFDTLIYINEGEETMKQVHDEKNTSVI